MILFLSVLFFPAVVALDLGCKGLSGRNVDWFVAYKLPDGVAGLPDSGLKYLYADSTSTSTGWKMSPKKIDEKSSAIGATLSQLWEVRRDKSMLFAVYNDDSPGTKAASSSRAHMKGALAFDDLTGFWMVHSVPNFVDLSKRSYSYPETAVKFGQTFMCLTLSVTALKEVGDHLFFSQPNVVRKQVPKDFRRLFPNLDKALNHARFPSKTSTTTLVQYMRTKNNQLIGAFSKNKKFDKDFYQFFLADNLNVDLAVESWELGSGKDLPSQCGGKKILNVKSVNLMFDGSKNASFATTRDHSKWAVSGSSSSPVTCIGDLNRQESQNSRGGGALCISNFNIWKLFRFSIQSMQCCDGRTGNKC